MAALSSHRAQGVTVALGCSAPGLSWTTWETPWVCPGWTSTKSSQVSVWQLPLEDWLLQELLKNSSQLPCVREGWLHPLCQWGN